MHIDVPYRKIDRYDVGALRAILVEHLVPLYDAPERAAWATVRERSRFIGQAERPADVGYRTMRPKGYVQFCLANDESPYSPWALPLPPHLVEALRPFERDVADLCGKHFGEGELHFCVFAVLAPGGHVPRHRDLAHDPEKKARSHHLHIPVIDAGGAAFTIGEETFRMEEGAVYEIDNTIPHSTANHGDTHRLNVMFDYRPAGAPRLSPAH